MSGRTRRFREEVVQLHREVSRRNNQRINASVCGYTSAFRRYEREYLGSVRAYQRRASFAELDRGVAKAEIVYVGDYHTLLQSQRSFVRILRRIPAERPTTVALEFVQGKHQRVVDKFMAGRLNEEELLHGIQHRTHWIFGGWEDGFQCVFELARERGYRIVGIDSMGRGAAGESLRQRDRYASQRLVEAVRDNPHHLVVVLIGELHIAPNHLPGATQRELRKQGLERKSLIVYQNCDEIHWQLASRGQADHSELVKVRDGEYALLTATPIVRQQSFLNWLDSDEEGPQLEAPERNFKDFARAVAKFFDLPIGDALGEVEVTTVVDLSFLGRLRRRGDFSAADIRQIQKQILSSQSYYIPKAKMVYLGNLSVNHASEEATHFLRHVCSGSQEPRLLVDAFYARVLEEALAFLGSKIINSKRRCDHVADFDRMVRSRSARAQDKRMARLVLRHTRMERGQRVRKMEEVYGCDIDMFNAVTHALGYRLGDRLYYALTAGKITKAEIRELFFDSFEEDGAALTTYLYLVARCAGVEVPERF